MELLSSACKDKYRFRKGPKGQVVTGLQVHLQKKLMDFFAFQRQECSKLYHWVVHGSQAVKALHLGRISSALRDLNPEVSCPEEFCCHAPMCVPPL